MGTQPTQRAQPLQAHQQLANEIAPIIPPVQAYEQEREARTNAVADRMAKSFAAAIMESQRNRPTPFWEHFALVILVTAACFVVIFIPIITVTYVASKIF